MQMHPLPRRMVKSGACAENRSEFKRNVGSSRSDLLALLRHAGHAARALNLQNVDLAGGLALGRRPENSVPRPCARPRARALEINRAFEAHVAGVLERDLINRLVAVLLEAGLIGDAVGFFSACSAGFGSAYCSAGGCWLSGMTGLTARACEPNPPSERQSKPGRSPRKAARKAARHDASSKDQASPLDLGRTRTDQGSLRLAAINRNR